VVYDEEAPVNAAKALVDLFDQDQVPKAEWAATPLFRDPRPGKHHNGPLRVDRVVNMDRRIMSECMERKVLPSDGKERTHRYGGHSYRIGGSVALMVAGCPVLTLRGMRRWVSECYNLYLRVGKPVVHEWQRNIGRGKGVGVGPRASGTRGSPCTVRGGDRQRSGPGSLSQGLGDTHAIFRPRG